jgi:hypothetical protein
VALTSEKAQADKEDAVDDTASVATSIKAIPETAS